MNLWGLKLGDEFPFTRQYGAKRALYLLTAINMLNFADRYVPSAVKQLIIDDLHITDFESSLPSTGMIVVYMICAVIFGTLSDKQIVDRRIILVGAVAFWSFATSLAGIAKNLVQLIIFRSLVGVGEAAYGTIAPPMLSDFYPMWDRNVVYGLYFLAIPVGGALGYGIGAVLGASFGWRVAFFALGIPGLFVALSLASLNDPKVGINDDLSEGMERDDADQEESCPLKPESSTEKKPSIWDSFRENIEDSKVILGNLHFTLALGGLVANNFALGGLAEWMDTYLLRYENASLSDAGLIVGAATIIGGIGGNLIGSKIADYYQPKIKSAYFLIPGIFSIPSGILLLFAVNISDNFALVSILLLLAEISVWTYLAPISALSITVIPPRLRARSCGKEMSYTQMISPFVCSYETTFLVLYLGLQIFFQHILGDIISPPIIGAISDSTHSLRNGLQICWIATFISGAFWFCGYYFLDPLPTPFDAKAQANRKQISDSTTSLSQELIVAAGNDETMVIENANKGMKDTTYCELLAGPDPLILVDGVVKPRDE